MCNGNHTIPNIVDSVEDALKKNKQTVERTRVEIQVIDFLNKLKK